MQFTHPQAVDDLVKEVSPLLMGKPIVDCGEALLLIASCLVASALDRRDDNRFINMLYEEFVDVVRKYTVRGQMQ